MNKIRVSCAGFAKININGKYLLLRNKRNFKNGETVYTPIGGGIKFLPNAVDFLNSIGGVLEKEDDLRIHIDTENYNIFKDWFLSKKDRETTIFREMREELVDEEKLLNDLKLCDFKEKKVNVIETTQEWIIDGESKTSYYFFEIFEVTFKDAVEKDILKNISVDDRFKFFTEEEITGVAKHIL